MNNWEEVGLVELRKSYQNASESLMSSPGRQPTEETHSFMALLREEIRPGLRVEVTSTVYRRPKGEMVNTGLGPFQTGIVHEIDKNGWIHVRWDGDYERDCSRQDEFKDLYIDDPFKLYRSSVETRVKAELNGLEQVSF